MMRFARTTACLGLSALALAGCSGSEHEELQQWMNEQRAQVRPNVPPIAEPKKFVPQAFTEGAAFEPVHSQKLTQALRRDSNQPAMSGLIAPELTRRKEALEAYPLDAMAMVGSLARNGQAGQQGDDGNKDGTRQDRSRHFLFHFSRCLRRAARRPKLFVIGPGAC